MGDTSTSPGFDDIGSAKSKVEIPINEIIEPLGSLDLKHDDKDSLHLFGDNKSTHPNKIDDLTEVEELHRSQLAPPDSPSSGSSLRQSASERPAAGAGGSSTAGHVVTRGRRHVRTSVFDHDTANEYGLPNGPAAGLGPQAEIQNAASNREIYSINGTRSIKINRHRDSVNVFPSGCMGVPEDKVREENSEMTSPKGGCPEMSDVHKSTSKMAECDKLSELNHGSIHSNPGILYDTSPASTPRDAPADIASVNHVEVVNSKENTPRTQMQNSFIQNRRSRPVSAVQRNPLTGVGYEDQDFIRQSTLKKRDGNPVLGQGYETKDVKPKKIPPGGYSKGLW